MRCFSITLAVIVALSPMTGRAEDATLDRDKIAAFVMAAWKPMDPTFRAVYFKQEANRTFDEQFHRSQISSLLTDSFKRGKLLGVQTEIELKNLIDEKVAAVKEKYSLNRPTKFQVFKNGDAVRIWSDFGRGPQQNNDQGTSSEYFESYLQKRDSTTGQFLGIRFGLNPDNPTASVYDQPNQGVSIDDAWNWGKFPKSLREAIQTFTSKDAASTAGSNQPSLEIDREKIQQLCSGNHPTLFIAVKEIQVDGVTCDQFSIHARQISRKAPSTQPMFVVTCERPDYSNVREFQAFVPNGRPQLSISYKSFNVAEDGSRHPKEVTVDAYSYKRWLAVAKKTTHNIVVESMQAPAKFTDEELRELAFEIPLKFLAYDMRLDKPLLLNSPATNAINEVDAKPIPIEPLPTISRQKDAQFRQRLVFITSVLSCGMIVGIIWFSYRERVRK